MIISAMLCAMLLALPAAADSGATDTRIEAALDEIDSPGLERYLASLNEAERQEFLETKLPVAETISVEPQAPTDDAARRQAARASSTGSQLSLTASGCWTVRYNGSNQAAAGNTVYTYYTVLGWCSNGSSVTSAWLADADGETATPGWTYNGVQQSDSGVVGNQGRAYARHRFTFGAGGWDVITQDRCLRVRGFASSGSTGEYICGIY